MAKRQITALSSPADVRTANEQLARAQLEYNSLYAQYTNKGLTAIQFARLAEALTSKYDYVDFDSNAGTVVVKGLGNKTQTTYAPNLSTTQSADDAYPAIRASVLAQQTNTPTSSTFDKNVYYQYPPDTVNNAIPDTTKSTGPKEAVEAGLALEREKRASAEQNGIIEDTRNTTATTKLPSGSQRYSRNDDAAPMDATTAGFGNDMAAADVARESNGVVVSGSSDAIPTSNKGAAGTKNRAGIEVKPNILHNYANWTYQLSWYMLSIDSYNAIAKTGKIPSNPGTLIARSGGVDGQLDGSMAGDVYFRNLRFTSVIGNRQAGAATNNIELEMTIVEPYGASLIGELSAMANNTIGKESASEAAYLLEIDFAGYKDDGSIIPSILGQTSGGKKYIPVKILYMEMKLEAAGAVYTITMAPYSLFAQTARYAEMEFGLKLEGKTVIEMLGGEGKGLIAQLNAREQKKKEENIITEVDEYRIDLYSFSPNGSRDQEMSSSPLAYPKEGGDSTIMKIRPASNNPSIGTYTIGKGNIIKDVIKNVVMASQYFNEKMTPKTPNDTSKPAELIKIIPVIEIFKDKFDPMRNEFAKRITYRVFNTLQFGEVYPYVGNAPVSDWGYCKEYNWLFTGENADVIEADLAFNFIYFSKMQTNVDDHNVIQLNEPAESTRSAADPASVSTRTGATKGGNTSNYGGNMPQRYINATLAAEWFDSQMMSNTADNYTLDLRIIGDPDWIPQDGSIRGGDISVGTNLYDKFGSIAVDVAGVYIKLKLQTPRDYNPKTGLMDLKKDKYTIEGIYRVITVENNFEDGKFTQTLNLVKVPNQETEKPSSSGSGGGRNANPGSFGGPR